MGESEDRAAVVLGVLSAAVAVWVSSGHMAGGPDAVTYLSLAESLGGGDGFRNWLESPMTTFPPGWPLVIWLLARVGLDEQWAATVAIAASLVVIPSLAMVILRRCTDVVVVRLLGVACVAFSPIVLPWGFLGLSEVPFTALVLAAAASAVVALDRERPQLLWVAVGCAALLPTIRYAGVAVPIALAAWIAWCWPTRRLLTAGTALAAGLVPMGVVLVVNLTVADSAFGGRPPSSLNLFQVALQGVSAIGRGALWAFDSVPGAIALVAGVAVTAATLYLVVRVGASEPPRMHAARVLLALLAVAQLGVLVIARASAEIDDLDDRLLAPASVLVLLLGASLVGDLARSDRELPRRAALGALALWLVIGLAATGRAVRNDNEAGYTGSTWQAIRSSEALDVIPEDCRRMTVDDVLSDIGSMRCGVLANDPWGWYDSELRPLMAPRRSSTFDGRSDVDRVRAALEDGAEVYLARTTVTEPYGYLLTLEELRGEFEVESLAADGELEVFRLTSTTAP